MATSQGQIEDTGDHLLQTIHRGGQIEKWESSEHGTSLLPHC